MAAEVVCNGLCACRKPELPGEKLRGCPGKARHEGDGWVYNPVEEVSLLEFANVGCTSGGDHEGMCGSRADRAVSRDWFVGWTTAIPSLDLHRGSWHRDGSRRRDHR